MEAAETPFGTVVFPDSISKRRRKATIKALDWCMTIIKGNAFWEVTPERSAGCGKGISRKVGKHTLTVFPLLAAMLDLGYGEAGRFHDNHVPVEINGNKVCVISSVRRSRPLHTDMVASIVQLFCVEKPPISILPKTLGVVLYPEDFPRRLANRAQAVTREIRNEMFRGFREAAVTMAAAIEYIENEMDGEEWILFRSRYPWEEMPNVALYIASFLMTPEHSDGDWLWVMDIHQRFDPEAYVSFLLPNLLTHFHTSVVLRALGEYEPPTADEAWYRISPLLDHPNSMVQWQAHQKLAAFEELEDDLVRASFEMVRVSDDVSTYTVTLRKMVAWLSHRIDMDAWIEPLLRCMETYELTPFLQDVRVRGAWFASAASDWIELPLPGLHAGLVTCSASNENIDHYALWKPLIERGVSGALQVTILGRMDLLTEEQAYEFLDMTWTSMWRFVLAKAISVVEADYPNYPNKRKMYEHILQTSPSPRLQKRCSLGLKAMEG